jgi:hypothetical protein
MRDQGVSLGSKNVMLYVIPNCLMMKIVKCM